MERFVLVSFPSAKRYAAYPLSEEYQRLKKRGFKEGMVMASMLKLTPNEHVIDKWSREWGDPYQPPGIDFFGWGGIKGLIPLSGVGGLV
jgi:hypothetical protein